VRTLSLSAHKLLAIFQAVQKQTLDMSKSEEARKNIFMCIIATVVLIVVAWLQKNGYLPKY